MPFKSCGRAKEESMGGMGISVPVRCRTNEDDDDKTPKCTVKKGLSKRVQKWDSI